MMDFWEDYFIEKQEMWGLEPAKSAKLTNDLFVKEDINSILIPGIGYGRNAQLFYENGMDVTGIEISETAINLARKNYGSNWTIYHGSVTDMPFDDKLYDGVFCHALIHLLNHDERAKLIQDCYNQVSENGCMVFTAITKDAPNFGRGKLISKDRYEFHEGAKIFYYDREAVTSEFGGSGLYETIEVHDSQPMFIIKCRKF